MRSELIDNRTLPIENLATNPSFERVGTGTTVVRRNLAIDPLGSTTGSGWGFNPRWAGNGGTQTVAQVTNASDGPLSGVTKYVRKTWVTIGSAALDISWSLARPGRVTVVPGRTYTISLYWRASWAVYPGASTWRNRINVVPYDSITGGTASSSLASSSFPIPSVNGWQRVSLTFTVPVGYPYLDVFHELYASLPSVGDTIDGTCLLVEERPALLPYFDGSTTDNTGIAYSWEGTSYSSSSVAKTSVIEVRRNLLIEPIPQASASVWIPLGGGTGTTVSGAYNASGGPAGEPFYRATKTADGTGSSWLRTVHNKNTPLTPSTVYTFSGWIRSSVARQAVIIVQWKSTTSVYTETASPAQSLTAGAWTKMTLTTTSPSDVASAVFAISILTGAVSGDSVDGTLYMVEQSSIAGTYFDGNTTPDADLTPQWTGAANASASTLVGSILNSSPTTYGGVVIRSWQNTIRGSGSARFISNVATAAESMFFAAGNFNNTTIMKPGNTYTALVKLRLLKPQTTFDASRSRKVWIRWAGGSTGTASSPQAPNIAGDYVLRVTATIPSNATGTMVQCNTFAPAGDGDLIWDELCIIQGAYTGPYLDGDIPGCVWRGTPHASTSIGYPGGV